MNDQCHSYCIHKQSHITILSNYMNKRKCSLLIFYCLRSGIVEIIGDQKKFRVWNRRGGGHEVWRVFKRGTRLFFIFYFRVIFSSFFIPLAPIFSFALLPCGWALLKFEGWYRGVQGNFSSNLQCIALMQQYYCQANCINVEWSSTCYTLKKATTAC